MNLMPLSPLPTLMPLWSMSCLRHQDSSTSSSLSTESHPSISTSPTCTTDSIPDDPDGSMKKRLKRPWMPPINADTLQELSMTSVFRSIQLRHDLVFDPCLCFRPNLDGSSGREKIKKAERYWRRVDRAFQDLEDPCLPMDDDDDLDDKYHHPHYPQRLAFLRVILEELCKILISLQSPFSLSPAMNEEWSWPAQVTEQHILTILDVDLILQQVAHGVFDMDPMVDLLNCILVPLCPAHEKPRLELLHRYVSEKKHSRALRQCFSILEAIKLNCANRVLKDYRQYLLETCPTLEYQCFMRQLNRGEVKLDSAHKWIRRTWRRVGPHADFLDVYHRGLVYLIADDPLTVKAYHLPGVPCPITFQFDERRLLQQFRQDFHNLILVSLVLIPYRHFAGRSVTANDMAKLKRVCVQLCWDMESTGFPVMASLQDRKEATHLYHRLIYKACQRGLLAHDRSVFRKKSWQPRLRPLHLDSDLPNLPASADPKQLSQAAHFWTHWLIIHLNPRSCIYQLMYQRICYLLSYISQHGPCHLDPPTMSLLNRMVGVQENILSFGEKLNLLADLNLNTFGPIYRWIVKDILNH
ncbi:hypothetical protein DM01DRAFT_1345381 [Hesseltinella vesiculosa]|uniref:Uncharacterized protein n=1 Tax=Hesseltinella vesiculosa TaxID=101127 RepID=A0A1X2GJ45_9FUNG|nr:hypothetical protein DM01DRAFT_1345381 [Hesseltinella vesiculosa]